MKRYFSAVAKVSAIMLLVINYPGLAMAKSSSEYAGQTYTYKIPERTEDGWETATLKEVALNPAPICKMVEFIRDEQHANIHCVLLIKDGRLVLEEYFHGYNRNKLHYILPSLVSPGRSPTPMGLPLEQLNAYRGRYKFRDGSQVARIEIEHGKLVGYSPEGERMAGIAHSTHEFFGVSKGFGPFKIKFIETEAGNKVHFKFCLRRDLEPNSFF